MIKQSYSSSIEEFEKIRMFALKDKIEKHFYKVPREVTAIAKRHFQLSNQSQETFTTLVLFPQLY